MTDTDTLSTVLVVAGLALVVAPALVPIEPVLVHDTRPGTELNGSQLRAEGYQVVAYENLSERGKELYLAALRAGGRYSVPRGQGAPEFSYPTPDELAGATSYRERMAVESVVVERPTDGSLPPADESLRRARYLRDRYEHQNRSAPSEAELRRRIGRYDLMRTRTAQPPIEEPTALARLLSAGLGVVAVGFGGYRRSKPR